MTVDAEGKVAPRPITTGAMSGPNFIVTDGLKGGEQVIVNGLQKARPGSVVKPVPWVQGAPILGAAGRSCREAGCRAATPAAERSKS